MQAEPLTTGPGELRWRLTDVIGLEDGLGVECLSGSGAIAGAYCKAFREVLGPIPWALTRNHEDRERMRTD